MSGERLRIGEVIQSIDVQAGGTATAFLGVVAAVRSRPELALRAYAAPPPEGDPAWTEIRGHADEWTTVAGYGGMLGPGAFGKSVIADIRAGKLDVVHLHGLWSPDLLAIGRACMDAGVRYVWQVHGMLARDAYAQKRWKKDLYMAMGMRRAICGARAVVFATAEERDQSLSPASIGAERQIVVPLPVEMPRMDVDGAYRRAARERFGLPANGPVVVFMGRLHPVKRVDMAIRALAAMPDEYGETRLLILGGGERDFENGLRALASRLKVLDRVVFGGWVKGEDKWRALAAGDVLTLNSVHENFGYVAVEAMCVGTTPVLTSNLALARELPTDERVSVVAEPTDEGLANGLARALRVRDAAVALREGRAWVSAHLSAEAVGERLLALFRSCMQKGAVG
jgi:glycosyltransferase involved in cell wall biosynthesis